MRVLVAYATRHGATAGIAERVAAALTTAGLSAKAQPVEDVKDVKDYDAVVLGGAAYMFHWLKPAVTFARRHRKELAARPVWLFSSGPLGNDLRSRRAAGRSRRAAPAAHARHAGRPAGR